MRKVKIVNKRKFIFGILVILLIILIISLILCKSSFSHGEIKYKEISISSGDTLWSIAREENRNNTYYENKDIRYIVYDIDKINNIGNNILHEGEKLLIPTI